MTNDENQASRLLEWEVTDKQGEEARMIMW